MMIIIIFIWFFSCILFFFTIIITGCEVHFLSCIMLLSTHRHHNRQIMCYIRLVCVHLCVRNKLIPRKSHNISWHTKIAESIMESIECYPTSFDLCSDATGKLERWKKAERKRVRQTIVLLFPMDDHFYQWHNINYPVSVCLRCYIFVIFCVHLFFARAKFIFWSH